MKTLIPTREAIKNYSLNFCESLVNEAPTKRSAIIRLKKAINSTSEHILTMKECLGNKPFGNMFGEKIYQIDLENTEIELDVMEYYLRFKLGYIYK